MKKLRLAAGVINRIPDDDEWINYHLDANERGIYDPTVQMFVKPDFVQAIGELPEFRDDVFSEVRCWHVLEHMPLEKVAWSVKAFYRVLKRGGVLDVIVPSFDEIAQSWVDGTYSKVELQQWVYGEDLNEGHTIWDCHRSAIGEDMLRVILKDVGFIVGERIDPGGLELRFQAEKP